MLLRDHQASAAAGIRLKSERGRGGLIENINYNNITLIDLSGQAVQVGAVGMPLTNDSSCLVMIITCPAFRLVICAFLACLCQLQMTLNYDPGVPPTNATATPQMRNVTVANVVAVNPGENSGRSTSTAARDRGCTAVPPTIFVTASCSSVTLKVPNRRPSFCCCLLTANHASTSTITC